ncbi:Polyadenylate-binding protein-interacting protein 5 [Spatholobus suberectus]|nr:Polyadenylate-binding protein-interacting protein 5 [Spatholobus suberectus]
MNLLTLLSDSLFCAHGVPRIKSTMAGASSSNPYAASYVAPSERVAEKDSKNHNEAPPQHDHHLLESKTKTKSMPQALQVKSSNASSSLQNVTEDDADVDIEYLKMKFPGIGKQSLRDVYLLNDADLDDAIDMLSQLELNGDESSETLYIGNVSLYNGNLSESTPADDLASPKPNNTAAEASDSSNPKASSAKK